MPKYECTVLLDASVNVSVEAETPEQAAQIAEESDDASVRLCHQCGDEMSLGDVTGVVVYDDAAENELLNTSYSAQRIRDLEAEISLLQSQFTPSLRMMAAIGESLMESIRIYADKGWSPVDSPAEIVGDLHNDREELRAELAAARREAAEAQALHVAVVQAWESLPEGQHSPQVIEQWMHGPMACAISELRRPNQTAVAAAIDKAIEQSVAPYKKDAERYRWLRSPDTEVGLVIDKRTTWNEYHEGTNTGGYWDYEYRCGDELDEAIDAAMRQEVKV